jgi:phosphotriesterase-related protein
VDCLLPIAEAGAYLDIDNIGFEAPYQMQEERARNVKGLIEWGYLEQILLSMDICTNSQLHYFGGPGYGYLLTKFLPLLEETGISRREIEIMMVENPRRALAF